MLLVLVLVLSVNFIDATSQAGFRGGPLLRSRRGILDTFVDEVIALEGYTGRPPPSLYLSPYNPVTVGEVTFSCLDGMASIRDGAACSACVPGTFLSSSGYCELCDVGTYQDQERQYGCLPCETAGRKGMDHCPLCVESCTGLQDKNYQSCDTCNGFVSCSAGQRFDMQCPGDTVWNNDLKNCEATSPTCVQETTTSASTVCVSNCNNHQDGYFASCDSCNAYVICSGGTIYNMACAAGLEWDDAAKNCAWESSTCDNTVAAQTTQNSGGTASSSCVSECSGVANGNYQSCESCGNYVTCSSGYKWELSCAPGLVWNDDIKACDWTSPTCS